MNTLRKLFLLVALLLPLVANAAESADEAVAGLIASLKDAGSRPGPQPDASAVVPLLERLLPHLAAPSRPMVESMVRASRAAREHDEAAREAFGAALQKEEGYMPA